MGGGFISREGRGRGGRGLPGGGIGLGPRGRGGYRRGLGGGFISREGRGGGGEEGCEGDKDEDWEGDSSCATWRGEDAAREGEAGDKACNNNEVWGQDSSQKRCKTIRLWAGMKCNLQVVWFVKKGECVELVREKGG